MSAGVFVFAANRIGFAYVKAGEDTKSVFLVCDDEFAVLRWDKSLAMTRGRLV